MQTENRLLEDLVKMANGFAGTMAGMAREGEAGARERVRGWLGGMDFVSRDEFEAVKAMAAAARDETAALRARLDALAPAAEPLAPTSDTPPPPIADAADGPLPLSPVAQGSPEPDAALRNPPVV